MKKIIFGLTILALIAFIYNVISNSNTLIVIVQDANYETYQRIIQKETTKESLQDYYSDILRYINYFIFFFDFKDKSTIIKGG